MRLAELTAAAIDAMPAGLEMDRLVAETIHDSGKRHDWEFTGLANHYDSVEQCRRCGEVVMDTHDGECLLPVSSEWRFAMPAVEKLGGSLSLFGPGGEIKDWACSITAAGGGVASSIGRGETGPLAICRAILKAAIRKGVTA